VTERAAARQVLEKIAVLRHLGDVHRPIITLRAPSLQVSCPISGRN
jgi:hypothetical protein